MKIYSVEKIPTCCLSKGVADLIESSTIVRVYVSDGSANGRLVCRGPQGGHFYLRDSGLLKTDIISFHLLLSIIDQNLFQIATQILPLRRNKFLTAKQELKVSVSTKLKELSKSTAFHYKEMESKLIMLDIPARVITAKMPSFKQMSSRLQKKRQKLIPTIPSDFSKLEISGDYALRTNKKEFFRYDNKSNSNRIIIFVDDQSLEILCHSDQWFMNGTFKSAPKQLMQLFTIHALVKFGSKSSTYPCVYILTQKKTAKCYKQVFNQLKNIAIRQNLTLKPKIIMADFEVSSTTAAKFYFPNLTIKGEFINLFGTLALIPLEKVTEGFEIIKSLKPNDPKCDEFISYFEKQLLNKVKPDIWNHHESDIRRSNIIEGFHSGLNKLLNKNHSNIFQLITFLKHHQSSSSMEYERLNQAQVVRKKSNKEHRKRPSSRFVHYSYEYWFDERDLSLYLSVELDPEDDNIDGDDSFRLEEFVETVDFNDQSASVVSNQSENMEQNTFINLETNITTNDLRNCLASFMDDECLKRFEFRVPKGPTNLFELEKHMVKLFGWQPASQTDAVAEFYNRKQLPGEFDQSKYDYLVKERFVTGLNEPSVFWRVDAAKPQTCAEAYDYARLEILKRNKPNIDQKSVVDQTEFKTEQSFSPKRPEPYHQMNKATTAEHRRPTCHFCNKSGHIIADCYARKNQMKNMTLNNQGNSEPSVSNRVINRVMFDESIVNFLFDTGTIKTIVARPIWDECKTPDSVLQPLSNILETCVGGPVNVMGKGRCSVKINNFNDDGIRQALTEQQMPKMSVNNLVVYLNPHEEHEREVSKKTEQNESLDSDDVEAYKLIIQDEFSNKVITNNNLWTYNPIRKAVLTKTNEPARISFRAEPTYKPDPAAEPISVEQNVTKNLHMAYRLLRGKVFRSHNKQETEHCCQQRDQIFVEVRADFEY
ncbi:unnamed protein product [Brachionus calyciflorus]|uniref:MULE transposase domain-containing protein n=1 Tax=Brachionus calyciflorus TaxID=104777 RepID=A0A814CXA6_9BILA|nr:unnamed protein product [Brachionus calyciflorus]